VRCIVLLTDSKRPRLVADTLVDAVRDLRRFDDKGFVFVRADGSIAAIHVGQLTDTVLEAELSTLVSQ